MLLIEDNSTPHVSLPTKPKIEPRLSEIAIYQAQPQYGHFGVMHHREEQDPMKGGIFRVPNPNDLQTTPPLRHFYRFAVGGPWAEGEGWR